MGHCCYVSASPSREGLQEEKLNVTREATGDLEAMSSSEYLVARVVRAILGLIVTSIRLHFSLNTLQPPLRALTDVAG